MSLTKNVLKCVTISLTPNTPHKKMKKLSSQV